MADQTIPQAPLPAPIAGPDFSSANEHLSKLDDYASANAAELEKAQKVASIPSAVGHNMTMPGSLAPRNNAAPQAQMNHSPVVGKHNAKMQGMGNAFTGVMNAVSSVATAEDNKKSKQVADATTKLMELQSSIDQAGQIQKDDPGYTAAQLRIQQSKIQMNNILSDKTVLKDLQKASVIDHTDPKAQDNPIHKGVFEGKKAFEARQEQAAQQRQAAVAIGEAQGQRGLTTTPLADRFSASQPTAYGQNPQAAAKVQQLQAKQAMIQESKKNYMDMVKEQMQYAGKVDPAIIRQRTEEFSKMQEGLNKMAELAQTKADQRSLANYTAGLRVWADKQIQYNKDTDPVEVQKTYMSQLDAHVKSTNELSKTNKDIEAQIAKTEDQTVIAELRGNLEHNKAIMYEENNSFGAAKRSAARMLGISDTSFSEPKVQLDGTMVSPGVDCFHPVPSTDPAAQSATPSGSRIFTPIPVQGASDGNQHNPTGGDPGRGEEINPVTGKPFPANITPAERSAVIAGHAVRSATHAAIDTSQRTAQGVTNAAGAAVRLPGKVIDSGTKAFSHFLSTLPGFVHNVEEQSKEPGKSD